MNESTCRRLKTEYLAKLKSKQNSHVEVKSLPTKAQGRPLLLGQELDKTVQDYIKSLRMAGGVVNCTIVMAAANGIIKAKDINRLSSHGGNIVITKAWARSLLNRMNYVKRKCSNAGKVLLPNFEKMQKVFLADIAAEVLMNDIPDQLIINWDHTGLSLVPTGQWTMHQFGDKIIPIANSDDKRQITAVLAANMSGELLLDYETANIIAVLGVGEMLAPQLIYKGKTDRCHPQIYFPEQWDIWHTDNHWSNEVTTKRYIDKILLPFVAKQRANLKLGNSHPALVLFDCFRGQTTEDVKAMLLQNNIISIQIPANCTDKLQPLDVSLNKPMKDELRARFHTWYASEVEKQMKEVPAEKIKVDVSMSSIKGKSASWIISSWQALHSRPEIAVNGFRKSGILPAVNTVRD